MPSLKRTLVLGSGSREHALAWKLAQSPAVGAVFVAPANGGIGAAGGKITAVKDLKITDHPQVAAWCRSHAIDLVVVGPEDPLAAGIVDHLQKEGIPTFGPSAAAARIESEKAFAKAFMAKYHVPTASYGAFTNAADAKAFIRKNPKARVVKASGLAAGKGVIVAETEAEALQAVEDMLEKKVFGAAGAEVVVEELLLGEEVSVFGLSDGTSFALMAPAQDHKRALVGDRGLNTGGMGAFAPYPLLEQADLEVIRREVFQRTIDGMRAEGTPFVGLLYAGLILTPDEGPKVIEFNCRFGDPETQSVLALLKSDLYEVFQACLAKKIASHGPLQWEEGKVAVGVVVASAGYPAGPVKKDVEIAGLEEVKGDGLLVFHGGTVQKADGKFYTSGGRILTVVALGESLEKAAAAATAAAGKLRIEGSFFRGDIAQRTIRRLKSKLDYKASGVDIEAGNALVEHIKVFAKSTDRAGVMEQIGGFGALFDLKAGAGLNDPILVSGTDGVGTKLKVAIETGKGLDTVGIDLVAMCVNDILVQGAEPLFFLDYFATSRLEVEKAAAVVKGIAEGCRQAKSALIGGETAEMPGMYAEGDFDLAGFAVGAVERNLILPQKGTIVEGDLIIGLSSSGVHSNGFSLVRKILEVNGVAYDQVAPFAGGGKTFADVLLTPTKIYVQSTVPAIKSRKVKALAHITGGGLTENIPRVLEKNLAVELDAAHWPLPPVFTWLKTAGGISEPDMLKTFNCGLGMVLFVAPTDAPAVLALLKEHGEVGHQIGRVVAKKAGEQLQVKVANFGVAVAANKEAIYQKSAAQKTKKKVAVLISGSGTNLKAIIEYVATHQATTAIDLALVISDKRSAPGLKFAEEAGIPTQVLVKRKEQSREQYDETVSAALREANIELVCLAGFMRLLSDQFVATWLGRLVNIHPALLPAFKGVDAYGQALAAGVRYTGCTAHFVVAEMDAGPIIDQGVVEVRREGGLETVESLTERGKAVEHQVYPRALEAVASGRVVATVAEDGSSLKVVFN